MPYGGVAGVGTGCPDLKLMETHRQTSPESRSGVTSESPRLTLSHCKVLSTRTHGDGYQRNVCWLLAHQLKENVVLTFTLEGKKIASLSLFLSFPFGERFVGKIVEVVVFVYPGESFQKALNPEPCVCGRPFASKVLSV